ncbi:MAG: hypothetical protein JO364_00140 [Pseudonocardiales bacterium]|nr:hypothetical protein [Pseudonocardiales bacterium]MBV9028719.1 hypothetical protein [Pseudonocardiales bacterium]
MSDAMSFAELAEQCVELLPARTVLSILRAGTAGDAGAAGEPGTHGAHGESIPGTTWWVLFGYDQSGSGYNPRNP